MTRNLWLEDTKAVAEAERFFAFIGRYVIAFQWLEGKVDEIFLLAGGQQARSETLLWLSKQPNNAKIEAFYSLISDEGSFGVVKIAGWSELIDAVVTQLHEERRRRNGLLHSQYVFDFLAIGAPVLRTDAHRFDGDFQIDHEELSAERCDLILDEVALLSYDLGHICSQLHHVYRGHDNLRLKLSQAETSPKK